jgi:hypothetical protein
MAPALTAEEIDALPPTFIGPTWERGMFGEWKLPEHTLGWQIAGWCSENLNSVAEDAQEGDRWNFTDEQLRFVLWWYAIDEFGRFIYRKGCLQRMKGWGKDPLLAVLCLVEFVGPSRFGGWNANGEPIGIRHPQAWVQITAVNQAQTTNTMALIPALMTDWLKAEHDIKDGAELIRAHQGTCRLEAVTSSYRALEGKRTTFTLMNETHHWVSGNNGQQMYETIDGNVTNLNIRWLAITNAYLPGEDSVAEKMREAYEKVADGRIPDTGWLYDSIEAHPRTPLTPEALRIVLPKIRGDAHWLVVEAIIGSVLDLTISPARSRRMWLNQIVADEDALYGPPEISAITDEGKTLQPDDEIVLGFDGGKTDDSTALVAIRVSDLTAFVLGIWEKPDGPMGEGWHIDEGEVDDAVQEAHEMYTVVGFYADVYLWESYIASWSNEYRETYRIKSPASPDGISWDMRGSLKRVTLAHERLMRAVLDVRIWFDGDSVLRRHMLNARRRSNNFGVSFGKEGRESVKKVDAYAAFLLAFECLHDLKTRVKPEKHRTGRGYFIGAPRTKSPARILHADTRTRKRYDPQADRFRERLRNQGR